MHLARPPIVSQHETLAAQPPEYSTLSVWLQGFLRGVGLPYIRSPSSFNGQPTSLRQPIADPRRTTQTGYQWPLSCRVGSLQFFCGRGGGQNFAIHQASICRLMKFFRKSRRPTTIKNISYITDINCAGVSRLISHSFCCYSFDMLKPCFYIRRFPLGAKQHAPWPSGCRSR